MQDRNENRPGYKKTKAGWIPEEWKCLRISKLIKDLHPGVSVNAIDNSSNNGEYAVLKVSAVANGVFKPKENKRIKDTDIDKARENPKAGNLIISRANTSELVGSSAYVESNHDYLFLSDKLWQTELNKENICSPKWLNFLLQLPQIRNEINVRATGTSGSMKNISQSTFLALQIAVPSFKEQNKIANIIYDWDDIIDQTRKLISAKKNRKKALIQQLFEKNELPKSFKKDKWSYLPLGSLITPVSRPVPKPVKPYIAIGLRSHGKGTFQRVVEEPEKVAMDTLYCIEQDDIIVNITFAWEGAIAIANPDDEGGLVSHRFPTYRVKKDADLSFLRQLIHTKRFVWDLGLISPGGAGRNRVLSKTDFLKLKVPVPSKAVQKKIGKILSSADQEIKGFEDKLTALEKQKRGLMQKLLTGEVRVKT
jgi:type I restriction enzyme S subunit